MWEISLHPRAEKELAKFDQRGRKQVADAIDRLSDNPLAGPGIKPMAGVKGMYRIRTGDYRIVYEAIHGVLVVVVIRVARKNKSTYKNL